MTDYKNTIELNGNLYDAKSGRVVGVSTITPEISAKPIRLSIDGFAPRRQQPPIHTKKKTAEKVHSKTLRSKTLMRRGVTKPAFAPAKNMPNDISYKPTSRNEHENLRLNRAQKIATSKHISRYGGGQPLDLHLTPVQAKISVRPEPAGQKPMTYNTVNTSEYPAMSALDIHLQNSLKLANAHKNKPLKKQIRASKTSKRLSFAFVCLAVALIGGFIAFQNSEILSVRIAAQRAGIPVAIPGYTPAGFRMNSHSIKAGEVTIGYKSTTDGRSFSLTQSVSSWDSGALVAHFLESKTYQMTQTNKGLQVYAYDGSNATWLDHGVWFNIYGDAQLSSKQLSELVNSI